jgi:hypothetical protein
MLWPIRDTAWTASFGWFLAMVIAFTAVPLIVTTTGIARRRVRLFRAPVPADPAAPAIIPATSGDRSPR